MFAEEENKGFFMLRNWSYRYGKRLAMTTPRYLARNDMSRQSGYDFAGLEFYKGYMISLSSALNRLSFGLEASGWIYVI